MELGLKGKRALVTGASAGLGMAAAIALTMEGVEVTINGRYGDRLNEAAKKIEKTTGHKPQTVTGDVSNIVDVNNILASAGEVDILVANAGGPPPGAFLDHTAETWRDATDLVLHSAVGLTRGVLDGMIKKGWGRVIYITSVGVFQPVDELVLSNATRAGVTGLCKTLSNTYADKGITFNCVCPGYTATERLINLAKSRAEKAGKSPEEIIDGIAANIPARRVGQPEELAALITFLSSDKAAYITGTSIPVDGGYHRGLL
ncbi:MAG TPA: SDR family oxidoreductase [candidate division Zixibacteria bacterium]|nr:SDR family oxidoreductase [candidate division Zixibacteria bacterium]